jgi:hypothetical protein
MDSLSSSLILLIVALVLLWLAVTDRLSRLLDAVDVLRGNATTSTTTASNNGATVTANAGSGQISLSLPSLPVLGRSTQVPV